ncbi:hypothetical protein PIB30_025773 [Stylosanthes scabra]|uniref:Uncharacterized protein n=1 Tax=Stylosanthes scabra TaxID=79078 RepID=A0ABU6SAG4_9FABA|nr:hypothetical protein [Stylosanthes scabra]
MGYTPTPHLRGPCCLTLSQETQKGFDDAAASQTLFSSPCSASIAIVNVAVENKIEADKSSPIAVREGGSDGEEMDREKRQEDVSSVAQGD